MQTQGERLKEVREILRLSRHEFAEKIGSSEPSIGKAERDKGNFGIEVYCNLAKNLNVSLNWLLAGKGEMFIKENNVKISDEFKDVVKAEVITLLNEYGIIDTVK